MQLQEAVDIYMEKVPALKVHCQRCLNVERWGGSIVLMIVDAAFDSIGLNYFTAVIPKVDEFRREFVETEEISNIHDLANINPHDEKVAGIWKNKRSWEVAKSVAAYLATLKAERGLDDREAFTCWAKTSELDTWRDDPVGKLKGVGINTFQYLRMMGGVDTLMPDKIVKRVVSEMLEPAAIEIPAGDIEFVRLVERIARDTGYKAVEICWMTWMVQSEAGLSRMAKYADLLPRI
jgi:hypothetical protein